MSQKYEIKGSQIYINGVTADGASKALDNLTSPTAVSQDLISSLNSPGVIFWSEYLGSEVANETLVNGEVVGGFGATIANKSFKYMWFRISKTVGATGTIRAIVGNGNSPVGIIAESEPIDIATGISTTPTNVAFKFTNTVSVGAGNYSIGFYSLNSTGTIRGYGENTNSLRRWSYPSGTVTASGGPAPAYGISNATYQSLGTLAAPWTKLHSPLVIFPDADYTNYVAFQAPTTVSSNVTWTLPSADGTSAQSLTTNGSGTLSWATMANAALSNLASVAINTNLIWGSGIAGQLNTADSGATTQNLIVRAGDSGGSGTAGTLTLRSGGNSGSNSTGAVTLQSGNHSGVGSGNSGTVLIATGSSGSSGVSGSITVQTGTSSVQRGDITLNSRVINLTATTGTAVTGNITPVSSNTYNLGGGTVPWAIVYTRLVLGRAGDFAAGSDFNTAFNSSFESGSSAGSANVGTTTLRSGDMLAGGTGTLGGVIIKSGANSEPTNANNTGSVQIFTGTTNATTGTPTTGAISISTGTPTGTNNSTGAISITTGTPTGSGTRGSITLNGQAISLVSATQIYGNIFNASNSFIAEQSGTAAAQLGGGMLKPSGGSAAGAVTGGLYSDRSFAMLTQDTAGSTSGVIYIETGNNSSGSTGDIRLRPGVPTGGTRGKIRFNDGTEAANRFWSSIDANGSGAWLLGPTSVKNYIPFNNFENALTTGWSLGTTGTLTNGLPTGTPTFGSGASGNLSITTVSSGQLTGTRSLSYASSAATTQGNMLASDAFSIDAADQAKVLTWSFYYKAQTNPSNADWSGTSSNSFGVAVWDVTNSIWLPTTAAFGMTQSSGVGLASGTFQTGATTSQLRFVIYNVNATSGAVTLYFDEFSVGPTTVRMGTPVGDWETFTPTWGSSGTQPTIGNGSLTGRRRRVGDSMEVEIYVAIGSTTSAGTGQYYFSLPAGYSIDTTKLPGGASGQRYNMGRAAYHDTGTAIYPSTVAWRDTTTVYPVMQGSGGTYVDSGSSRIFSNTVPAAPATGDEMFVSFTVPIVGWSSSVLMSNDTDTRVVAFHANGTGTTINSSSPTTLSFSSTVTDTHSAFNGTTTYTVPVSGQYDVSFTGAVTVPGGSFSATAFIVLQKNGVDHATVTTAVSSAVGTGNSCPFALRGVYSLKAGDTLVIRANTNNSIGNTTLADARWNVVRLSGPATIAASESISLQASNTSGGSVTNSSWTKYSGWTTVYDSHGSFNAGTGTYTVPESGNFMIGGTVGFASNASGIRGVRVYKNGSQIVEVILPPASGNPTSVPFSVARRFNANDTIEIYVYQSSGGTLAVTNNVDYNQLYIQKVGN